jgi:uncharacterized membrane protein YqjE
MTLGVKGGPVPPDKKPPPGKMAPLPSQKRAASGQTPSGSGTAPPPPQPGPAGSQAPPPPPSRNGDKTVGELFLEVSEQATVLVREEIELAKTEITEKATSLLRGSAVGLAAGIFLIAALFLIMNGIAILLGDNVFGHRVWLGYLVEAVIFILIAAVAGFYAYKAVKKAAPPKPEMAIEQAKEIRATLDSH